MLQKSHIRTESPTETRSGMVSYIFTTPRRDPDRRNNCATPVLAEHPKFGAGTCKGLREMSESGLSMDIFR